MRLTQTNTTDEGFSFSFHKNYKLGPTYPRLAIFSLRELNQTSPLVCFEGWNTFLVPIWSPWEPNLSHRRRGCQLGLLSINFVFWNVIFQPMVFPFVWAKYKWSTNEILWEIVASSPFLCPSQLDRSRVLARLASLAQIGELARRLLLKALLKQEIRSNIIWCFYVSMDTCTPKCWISILQVNNLTSCFLVFVGDLSSTYQIPLFLSRICLWDPGNLNLEKTFLLFQSRGWIAEALMALETFDAKLYIFMNTTTTQPNFTIRRKSKMLKIYSFVV